MIGVVTLAYCVAHKIKVYVHCKHGHGRAPTLVAAYFIREGMTVQEAIDKISKHRPAIHPTDEQLEALQNYAKSSPQRELL
jgi:protein-tyrosine phosphatase